MLLTLLATRCLGAWWTMHDATATSPHLQVGKRHDDMALECLTVSDFELF